MKKFPYTVLAIVVCLVLMTIAFTAGAVKAGLDSNSTPTVLAVIAMVSGMVPALLALVKSEQNGRQINETRERIESVHEDLGNGVMEAHIVNAVRKANGKESDAIPGKEG